MPAQLNPLNVSKIWSEANLTGAKYLLNEMFTPLNAEHVYLGQSLFHRGFVELELAQLNVALQPH